MLRCLGRTLLLTTALLLIPLAGTGQAQLVLYDDFSSVRIDPTKWFAPVEVTDGPLAPNAETERGISRRRLRLSLTTYGGTGGSSDIFGFGRQRVRFPAPGGITTIEAKVTVGLATTQDCPANPRSTLASAQLAGTFFNDGTPSPRGREGDILAAFGKFDDSRLGKRIEAIVTRCDGSDCATPVASHVFGTSWASGAIHTLRLEWDAAAHLFRFTVDPGGPGEETATLPYGFSDTTPLRGVDFKELRVENKVAECSGTQKRATISAFFDDVMINP